MEVSYPLEMAIYDFVPVIFFLVGGLYLTKITVISLQKYLSWIFFSGVLFVFLGGAFKATWKLLYTANIADIQWMSELQFILMSIRYIATLVPLITLTRSNNQNDLEPSFLLAIWKIPFLIITTLTCLGTYATLAIISYRRHLRWAAAGFMISFFGVIQMGFLTSRSQSVSLQWIEQTINSVINISFAISSFFLYRNMSTQTRDLKSTL